MHPLLSLFSTTSAASILGSAPAGPARDGTAADPAASPFAALLDSAAANAEAGGALAGIELPTLPGSGKILPPALPPLAEGELSEADTGAADGTLVTDTPILPMPDALLAAMVLPQPFAAPPVTPSLPEGTTAESVPFAQGLPTFAGRPAAPAYDSAALAAPPAPVGQEAPTRTAGVAAVTLTMDAAPATNARLADAVAATKEPQPAQGPAVTPASPGTPGDQQGGGEAPSREGSSSSSEAPQRLSANATTVVDKEAPAPVLATAQPATPAAAQPATPSLAPQPGSLQDITAIVDRLAAAREALAPAGAAIALNHAEFGEMTLRFEQQKDGQLVVGLSASNPDAHRAVAAALATERNPFTGSDQQQQQAQQRSASGSGNADRGATSTGSGPGAGAGGNQPGSGHARPDSQRDGTGRQGWRSASPTSSDGGSRRGGIYA